MYIDNLPLKSHYEVSVFFHVFMLLIILTEQILSYGLPWAEESNVWKDIDCLNGLNLCPLQVSHTRQDVDKKPWQDVAFCLPPWVTLQLNYWCTKCLLLQLSKQGISNSLGLFFLDPRSTVTCRDRLRKATCQQERNASLQSQKNCKITQQAL